MNMRKINLLAIGLVMGLAVTGCAGKGTKEAETKTTEVQMTETQESETETQQVEATEARESETETQREEATEAREAETETQKEEATETQEQATESTGLFGTFETKTLDGEPADQNIFSEADLNMVNIWGTFCSPCIQEMPDIAELAEEYEEKGVRVIGIISDVTEPENEAALQIVEKTKADYTHLLISETLWNNYLMYVQAVPTTVFLDSDGKQVGESYVGARGKEEWAAIIDEKLKAVGK